MIASGKRNKSVREYGNVEYFNIDFSSLYPASFSQGHGKVKPGLSLKHVAERYLSRDLIRETQERRKESKRLGTI